MLARQYVFPMISESTLQVSARSLSWWLKILQRVRHPSKKGWIGLSIFVVLLLLLALHSIVARKDANLHLKLTHAYRKAKLSVWVDDDLAYSGSVTGYARKRFGLIPEPVQGTMSELIPVSSGQHRVRVRLEPEEGPAAEGDIAGDFASHNERDLSVSARHSGLSLAWQAVSAAPEPSPSASLGHYANWLLLTILGSLISAVTGLIVREFPGMMRTRPDSQPKA